MTFRCTVYGFNWDDIVKKAYAECEKFFAGNGFEITDVDCSPHSSTGAGDVVVYQASVEAYGNSREKKDPRAT